MITVNIPATFASHAAIYEPSSVGTPNGPETKFRIAVPAQSLDFEGCNVKFVNQRTGMLHATPFVHASTSKAPAIMIGDGSDTDMYRWGKLCEYASQWRIPLDVLLIGRELNVAVKRWTPQVPGWARIGFKDAVALHAVQILGDLTKSQALNDRIDEIKGWFEQ